MGKKNFGPQGSWFSTDDNGGTRSRGSAGEVLRLYFSPKALSI